MTICSFPYYSCKNIYKHAKKEVFHLIFFRPPTYLIKAWYDKTYSFSDITQTSKGFLKITLESFGCSLELFKVKQNNFTINQIESLSEFLTKFFF